MLLRYYENNAKASLIGIACNLGFIYARTN